MAVKASDEVTVYDQTDATAIREWHYASTSATAPARPTTTQASATPSGWSLSEPTVATEADLAKYDYACLQTVWGDGTCTWGDVTLSAAFEAAKVAWNKASSAYAATQPIASKTYAGLIGSANDAANASFYFAKVHPTAYAAAWMVKLRLVVTAPTAYSQIIDITICGDNSNCRSYDSFTQCNGSRGIYYINLYRATSAGISAGKGHALGIGLRGSTNPTTASAARTVRVDVLEAEGCTVSMLDTAVKYASMDGTGSTNYAGLTELNVAGNGQNATNNANTYNRLLYSQAVKARQQDSSHTGYVGTHIICGDINGYINIAAGAKFDLSYPLLWYATAATTTIASGSTANNHYLRYESVSYTVNGTVQSGAPYKMVYLKGTVVGNTFTIAASPFMTTVVPTTEDGYCYIPLGSMTSTTAGSFVSTSQLYAYRDGAFGPVSIREASAAAKTATNYISSDSTGIKIANADPATATTYQHQTAGSTEFVVGGAKRSEVSGNGLEVFDGDAGLEESVALFGQTQRMGKENEEHLELSTDNGLDSLGRQTQSANLAFFGKDGLNENMSLYTETAQDNEEYDGYEKTGLSLNDNSNHVGFRLFSFIDPDGSLVNMTNGDYDTRESRSIELQCKNLKRLEENGDTYDSTDLATVYCQAAKLTHPSAGLSIQSHLKTGGVYVGIDRYDNEKSTITLDAQSVKVSDQLQWTNLALDSSKVVSYSNSTVPRYKRFGCVVTVEGAVKPTANYSAGGEFHIGLLPAGFRPSRTAYFICQGSGTAVWMLEINAEGNLYAKRYRDHNGNAAFGTSTWFVFCVTFMI